MSSHHLMYLIISIEFKLDPPPLFHHLPISHLSPRNNFHKLSS
uniref:Uncharacterized protein n=1 Tax=Rhizophora mucronata TaxID=61149 RepID=A0A2P2QNT3_RHIMU